AVQQVIFRALEKDPDKRYADAAEFAAAVEDAFQVHDARHTRPARTAAATTVVPMADQTLPATTIVTAPRRKPWKIAVPLVALVLAVALFALRERLFAPAVDYGKFYAVVIG